MSIAVDREALLFKSTLEHPNTDKFLVYLIVSVAVVNTKTQETSNTQGFCEHRRDDQPAVGHT